MEAEMELSALVNYIQPVHFRGFDNAESMFIFQFFVQLSYFFLNCGLIVLVLFLLVHLQNV